MSKFLNDILVNMRPLPDRFLPRWAVILNVKTSVQIQYCARISINDRLPRGAYSQFPGLRQKLLKVSYENHDIVPMEVESD